MLKNASSLLKNLDKELKSPGSGDAETTKPSLSDGPARTPIPVEVHQPDPGASEALIAMLRPLAAPFTTTGIVVIFLIFFLFSARGSKRPVHPVARQRGFGAHHGGAR
ncbi:hypothetical protein JQ634_30605 [Bradyrhizobium sp. AUGA SZCCT0240]|uniref:hypothetical protein n=1 Tax=unclassified Bradyrhizobium TaxID=2631580 RepID=UPI001BABC036|nr:MULTISPECIES: hypothetical protein [unclassified Bradyrhizobium]MBR1193845.1 hypothetical protein [Bradyrhizobium sp. AUGA SZCCT0160]MBR1244354.1 hypothetical protein [Bradyrhizobium sp. AUGA SZCCT0274]MBR1258021.1 hypothetical protein [Bradyrhizobium sp. AUGA SZCCT0240]